MEKKQKAVIIMGSGADVRRGDAIAAGLKDLGVDSVLRVASAHKSPLKCIEIIKEYEDDASLFITIAGRSNALSGFIDAQTRLPVIACPPYGEKYAGADIFSTVNMPSGVAPMFVADAGNAALAAAKIIALSDSKVHDNLKNYRRSLIETIDKQDEEVMHGKR
jgi:5-(carboxyamino)imidazole ribonucleotide mutase